MCLMEEILHQLICIYIYNMCIHIQNNSVNTLPETNISPLKINGWKPILSLWGPVGLFSGGLCCFFQGVYKMGPLQVTTISGFIPSYTHLQAWLNRVCWGYNYPITGQGATSCNWESLNQGVPQHSVPCSLWPKVGRRFCLIFVLGKTWIFAEEP